MKASDIMISPVHMVSSEKSVLSASDLMNSRRADTLVVVDYGIVKGIVTSRHLSQSHPNRIVADAMTSVPASVSPDTFVWDAMKIMERHRMERLVVTDRNEIVGWLTKEAVMVKLSELIDPLTGLYRAPYIQYIGEEFLKSRRPFHLLFIDLDNFGDINKYYGHPFGDDVIREFSNRLVDMLEEDRDYVCRYAGDEFIVISLAPDDEVARYIQNLSGFFHVNNVPVSSAVGYVDGSRDPDFHSMSFRDLLKKASLLSTAAKLIDREQG